MKRLFIFSIVLSILLLSPNLILAQPDPLDNPKVPYIIDDEGNGVNPGSQKNIIQDIADIILGLDFSSVDSSALNNQTTIPVGPGTIAPSIYPTYSVPPNIASAGETQYADAVTKLIHKDCIYNGTNGVVTKLNTVLVDVFGNQNPELQASTVNKSCLTNTSKIMNNNAIKEIEGSVTSYFYLQCVACARAMGDARNRPFNGVGNAKNYIGQQVSGYSYFENTPLNYDNLIPGSIGISNFGTYGHIFYITRVDRDETTRVVKGYKAFECNYGPQGYVRHDLTRAISDGKLTGWQRPNSL